MGNNAGKAGMGQVLGLLALFLSHANVPGMGLHKGWA